MLIISIDQLIFILYKPKETHIHVRLFWLLYGFLVFGFTLDVDKFAGRISALYGHIVLGSKVGFYNLQQQCVTTHFASHNCAADIAQIEMFRPFPHKDAYNFAHRGAVFSLVSCGHCLLAPLIFFGYGSPFAFSCGIPWERQWSASFLHIPKLL